MANYLVAGVLHRNCAHNLIPLSFCFQFVSCLSRGIGSIKRYANRSYTVGYAGDKAILTAGKPPRARTSVTERNTSTCCVQLHIRLILRY